MRTAEAVLIEVMNIQDRVGDGKTHINDVVNAVRAYGEEVKEACATLSESVNMYRHVNDRKMNDNKEFIQGLIFEMEQRFQLKTNIRPTNNLLYHGYWAHNLERVIAEAVVFIESDLAECDNSTFNTKMALSSLRQLLLDLQETLSPKGSLT